MNSSVMVHYPSASDDQIEVRYSIEQSNNLQTISCSVEVGGHFPVWLQLRKFSISSIKKYGNYTTLFNEINNSRNMDTSLFIDLVYSSIMKLENCKCS